MSKFEKTSMRSAPAFTYEGRDHHHHHHHHHHNHHHNHVVARGTSPHRGNSAAAAATTTSAAAAEDKNMPSHHRGHPRQTRSLSPFSGGSSKILPGKNNVIVCHPSAHAVVFRDSVRMAAKIIQEDWDREEEEEEQEEEEVTKDSGASSSSSSENEEKVASYETLRNSIRTHATGHSTSKDVVKEINQMAHELVPEIKSVTLNLKTVSERNIEIEGLHAHISPLDDLEFNTKTEFVPLLQSPSELQEETWTLAEQEVYTLLEKQQACVKTIQKFEWPSFLQRFKIPKPGNGRAPPTHEDIPPGTTDDSDAPFNSFVTSTSLLPSLGKKMRCYGSELSYPVGVVFALPHFDTPEQEHEAVKATETWAWPAGYAAKTEFNIDNRGQLINGRKEALVPLSQMRQYNYEYVNSSDHYIGGRIIKGGFSVVPYNECFLRVGGCDRIVNGKSVTTQQPQTRSLQKGCGLFVALFIRTTTMGDIVNLFRTKARIAHALGKEHLDNIPLLYLHPDHGVRVFTKQLQHQFWKQASCQLQPFVNPSYSLTTQYHETNDKSLNEKMEELMDLDQDLRAALSHHELAKIAGGFGVTDESFLTLLVEQPNFEHVHDIMQHGFAAAIRANDYYGARQSLILYALANTHDPSEGVAAMQQQLNGIPASIYSILSILKNKNNLQVQLPFPLATKRWRRSTNSSGILVVLGAAQILKTITTSSAKRRTEESYVAVEEWVHHGEESVAFRVASWREQRADEADTNIAMSQDSKFWAFVTDKSVHNRRKFAQQLRKAAPADNFTTVGFLQGIYDIVEHMHSPCMRLELLQYILALDNRYSVELIKESIQLAATCLSVVPVTSLSPSAK